MELERRTQQTVSHYYQLSVPDGNSHGRLPLLIALHGYAGDMSSMMRVAKGVAGEEMLVASLQGPHQFWVPSVDALDTRKVGFGWLTQFKSGESQERHHELVRKVIRELHDSHRADVKRVFLMGFSQACALNYRFAFTHPGVLRGVVGVCGGIPGDFDNPKYTHIPAAVLHVATREDQYYRPARTRLFESALRRLASDVSYREYDGPHAFPRRSIPFIHKWILDRC
jgi:predicted esterase